MGKERGSASQGAKSTGAGLKPLTPLCTKGYERLDTHVSPQGQGFIMVCNASHLPFVYFITVNVSSPERKTTFIGHQLFQ